jgi:hypothetical protein
VLSAATVVLGTDGWATAVVSVGVGVGSVGVEVGSVGLEVGVCSVVVGARGVVVVGRSDVGSAVADVVLVGSVGVGRVTVGGVTAGPVTVGSVTVGGVAVGAVTVGDTSAVRDGLRVGRFTSPPPAHAVSRMAAPTVRATSLVDDSSFIRRSLLGRAVHPRLAAA